MFQVTTKTKGINCWHRNTYYVSISKYLLEDYTATCCAAQILGCEESSIVKVTRIS